MLNTSHISASGTLPQRWIRPKTGCGSSGASIVVPDVRVQAQQVQQAVAGDVREPVDATSERSSVQRGAHVDHRRLQQLVGQRAAELGRRVVERQAALLAAAPGARA